LPGCDRTYYKILKENQFYYFYNNYVIDPETEAIECKMNVPEQFYNVNHININISAIVGKNGSGKSTLVELLIRIINNMARKQEIPKSKFHLLEGVKVAIYYHTDAYYKLEISGKDVFCYKYQPNGTLRNKKGSYLSSPSNNKKLEDFFYSIIVNYSHYAYNTSDNDEEDWLDNLFIKNDGYQTPVVINPLRRLGNVDINSENYLVKSRMIVNFLSDAYRKEFSFRNVSNNYTVTSMRLILKKSVEDKALWSIPNEDNIPPADITIKDFQEQRDNVLSKLNELNPFKYQELDKVEYKIALDYVYYKLISICLKYVDYTEYFSQNRKKFHEALLDSFLSRLVKDNSHITFKLKQTLNFLLFQNIRLEDQTFTLDWLQKEIVFMRKKYKKKQMEMIQMIPPPIFETEILMTSNVDPTIEVPMKSLSSGEKQMLNSMSTILYHLVNLNSITKTKKRMAFRFVNIVLEEIELYFHPELQRTFIMHILSNIEKIKLDNIKGINFLFITHSPFILSDIPEHNIMFLNDDGSPHMTLRNEDDKKERHLQTFGANIHDLLSKSFFLANGLIGGFAKGKIQELIDHLKTDASVDSMDQEEIYQTIQLIGEAFLREKLMEMYYLKFEKVKRIQELKAQLERLENG
jgi:energy-coupling factor transporter ATP-binding protein EcfA2